MANTKKTQISHRYALGLMELLNSVTEAESYKTLLTSLANYVSQSSDFKQILVSPAFSEKEKEKVLTIVLEKMDAPKTFYNFITILCESRRTELIEEISSEFNLLLNKKSNTEEAFVQSASELSTDQLNGIKTKIEKKTNKKIVFKVEVKESLVAGMKITVSGKTYDSTINNQIDHLKNQLMVAGE